MITNSNTVIKKIVIHPNKILNTKCAEVNPKEMEELIANLWDTLNASETGIGLAAPQIGVNARVFVVKTKTDKFVAINPQIVWSSTKEVEAEEGCLSIPNYFVNVRRPEMIRVEYFNAKGKKIKQLLSDKTAVVFQHENDHLNGKLIIQKSDSNLFSPLLGL